LEQAGLVVAVEKDRELVEFLQEKFAEQIKGRKLTLINDDILEFDIAKLKIKNYKLISNIPYNITGAILKKFLTAEQQPERMVLMVQREVAKRITTGLKESILSISVKAYGEPKMIMKVPARYFSPAPKVDSAIISIKNISRKNFYTPSPSGHSLQEQYTFWPRRSSKGLAVGSHPDLTPFAGGERWGVQHSVLHTREFEEKFWEIVKAGFAHKRKKLSSNLRKLCQGRPLTSPSLSKAALDSLGNKRAEDLSLEDWITLARQ